MVELTVPHLFTAIVFMANVYKGVTLVDTEDWCSVTLHIASAAVCMGLLPNI